MAAQPEDKSLYFNREGASSMVSMRWRAGLTLIELLVAIAVIAILAAFRFAVFAQPDTKTDSSHCLSHQKQIAFAFSMYAQDYDETYPPSFDANNLTGTGPGGIAQWEDIVKPYIKAGNVNGILTCPSASSQAYAYSMNFALARLEVAQVVHPADTVLTADSCQAPNQGNAVDKLPQTNPSFVYTQKGGEVYWVPKPDFNSGKGDPNAIIDPAQDENTDDNFGVGFLRYRHNQSVNTAFADGHTRYVRQGAFRLSQWHPNFQTQ
jgi:prepilin-type N-terminal cleavage/methylation domain-containing protein/prepilin-type processing-associated H-X9-DG protein